MGGTYSSNQQNLQNLNSPLTADYVSIDRNLNTPHNTSTLSTNAHNTCNDRMSIVQINNLHNEGSEPHLLPKITSTTPPLSVNNTNRFRIHPIKQKGIKLSDTHYFIIDEPKHKRCNSERIKRHLPDTYVNANIIGTEPYEEPELPYDLNEQISQEYIRSRPVKRGQSESHKQYVYNMHRGLVVRMLLHISSATEMECNSVLIGANWDFDVAEKRLKVDMLHRKGFVNQQRCTQLLDRFKWNLSEAERQAEREFKQMILERQQSSNSSRSHQSTIPDD